MKICYIDEMAFAGIPNLRSLCLVHTGLMAAPPLNPVKNTLEELDLTFNHISSVPRGYFVGFKNLAKLGVRHNLLHDIPDITPLRNTITHIHLNFNKVKSLSGALNGTIYSKLKGIYLARNSVTMFNSDLMSFWPDLRQLDMTENRIVELPTNFSQIDPRNCSNGRKATSHLTFRMNPIHCDNKVENIITRRPNNYNYADFECNIRIVELMQTKCASPTHLCGRDLMTLGMYHDDVIKWKHFPRYWPFVRGSHWSTVDSPHKGLCRGALMFCNVRLNKRLSKQSMLAIRDAIALFMKPL